MNKEELITLIKIANNKSGIKEYVLEKDFYIVNILRELAKKNGDIIFKGGTCLSKAYKVVERFSEDVDITLKKEVSSQSKIREFNKLIEEVCFRQLGLKTKKDLQERFPIMHKELSNKYFLDYEPVFESDGIKEYIELDSSFITKVEEAKKMTISPMIQEILDIKDEETLLPFEIYIQPIEMIIADKFFAICKNFRRGNVTRYSRHFYDICQTWNKIISKDKNSIKRLQQYVKEVALAEKNKYSSNELVEIKDMETVLDECINSEKYRNDYEIDLPHYIYGDIPKFEECCKVLKQIISLGTFKGIDHYFIGKKKKCESEIEESNKKIFIYECIVKDIIEIKNLTQNELKNKYCNKSKEKFEQCITNLRKALIENGEMHNDTRYYITKYDKKNNVYFVVGQNIRRSIALEKFAQYLKDK